MKQIVDKLNKIAKKIDESVEIPQTDLIIDSLDAITKAYGGTPNDSNLIVDKLEDIYNNIEPAVSGNIEITENGENINVAPYATATVNVSGGGDNPLDQCKKCVLTLTNGDTEAIASDLLIDMLIGTKLVEITVTDGKLDSVNSYIDNHMPSINLTPGNSLTYNLYYVLPENPGDPTGIAFNANTFTFAFSNISNMEVVDAPGVTGYQVTDTDNDSAITVTATITEK